MIFLSPSCGAVVLQKVRSVRNTTAEKMTSSDSKPFKPLTRALSPVSQHPTRRRLTQGTISAELNRGVDKIRTKMAWHVPIWAYPPDERLTKSALLAGTTWPPPTNGIGACMFCSAFLRADGDERLGCFQNQPWTSRSHRLRLTPNIEQILL